MPNNYDLMYTADDGLYNFLKSVSKPDVQWEGKGTVTLTIKVRYNTRNVIGKLLNAIEEMEMHNVESYKLRETKTSKNEWVFDGKYNGSL